MSAIKHILSSITVMERLEFVALALLLFAAAGRPRLGSRWLDKGGQALLYVSRYPRACIAGIAGLVIAARLMFLPIFPAPQPYVHDEFSYLLAADTFAHGRLANPAHPLWRHFETFHVLQEPTYASKYPPAQGVFMAVGQRLTSDPWAGVLISDALMCAGICWMLQAWVPPPWALAGSLIAVLRLGLLSYWINSYWGGAVAAIGGALVLGALPRIQRDRRLRDTLLLVIGVAVLANSRPYEGVLLCIPAFVLLLFWMLGKDGPPYQATLARVALPISLGLICIAAAMGYYNWRVTHSPILMPYQVHEATYGTAAPFLWQHPRSGAAYHNDVMREFYTKWQMSFYERQTSLSGLLTVTVVKVFKIWRFFFGPLLTIPLLAGLIAPFPGRKFLLLASCFWAAAMLIELMLVPHYAAPFTAVFMLITVQGLRFLHKLNPAGQFLARSIPVTTAVLLVCAVVLQSGRSVSSTEWTTAWGGQNRGAASFSLDRANSLASLSHLPGRHLVLVRYRPGHNTGQEWVYNEADIDNAKVVWARELDESQNRRLIEYFKDRRLWLADVDRSPNPIPYPAGNAENAPVSAK